MNLKEFTGEVPDLDKNPWLIGPDGKGYLIKNRVSPQQIYLEVISGFGKWNPKLISETDLQNFTPAIIGSTIDESA